MSRQSFAVLAIDQGTTGTRAIVYDRSGNFLASAYQEFCQHYPRPGWVEHDPEEIWKSVLAVTRRALQRAQISASTVAAIGITNQRETTVLWDRKTGKPLAPAIVWQDRRTAEICLSLKKSPGEKIFRDKTGLVLDPYFSGTKIQWLLQHLPGLKRKAANGKLAFGTIDSWLLWNLTGGRAHATDFTNASRTLLFNIRTRRWDPELLKILKIPESILPAVQDSGSRFGETVSLGVLKRGVPIFSMIGDQQAALYGQACYRKGEVKNTYGTGCFVVLNLGSRFQKPPFGLLATLACDEKGQPVYALEGSVFIAGAAIQWLRDGLGFFKHAQETEKLAKKVKDAGGVTVIPAFAGLASPYWNASVRGVISGLTRGTTRAHIVRATLESIAHQTADVLDRMKEEKVSIRELKVDGGATENSFLMQFQADLLGIPILVSDMAESTAWGAAKLAAKTAGLWPSLAALDVKRRFKRFVPRMKRATVRGLRHHWQKEVERLLADF